MFVGPIHICLNTFYLFIYFCLHWVFAAVLGLLWLLQVELLLATVCGLLIKVASLVAEHWLCGPQVQSLASGL